MMAESVGSLRVVEVGDTPAAALTAKLLCAMGGEVVKAVDSRPSPVLGWRTTTDEGVPTAVGVFVDEGKQRKALEPGDAFTTLIADADVVVSGLTSDGFAELTGTPYAEFNQRWPSVILACAPLVDDRKLYARAASELQAQALSGMMTMIGEPDRQPLRLPGWQASFTAAATMITGIMMALHGRDATEQGATVSTTAVRSMAYLDWKSQIFHEEEGTVLRRGSDRGPAVVECSDGFAGFYYRPEDWPKVRGLLNDPRLDDERFATQRGRDEHREAFVAVLNDFTRPLPRRDLYDRAQAAGIPVGPVWTLQELVDDPQYEARGFMERRVDPNLGTFVMPRTPFTVDGERPACSSAESGARGGR